MKSMMCCVLLLFGCMALAQDEVPIVEDCHCAGSVESYQRPWGAGWPDCFDYYHYRVDVVEHGTCQIPGSEVCTEELKCEFFGWFESWGDYCEYEIVIEGITFQTYQGDYWWTKWDTGLWCGWTDYPVEIYIDGVLMVVIIMNCDDCTYYTGDVDAVPGDTSTDGGTETARYQRPWYISVFDETMDLSTWDKAEWAGERQQNR
ncbi:MAG: hypothetical protein QNK37_31095 [Acidobacteriota bacterium]|nr:hypothetical protein [Acidobacteriota bacterium]